MVKNLKKLRNEFGISQQALAEKIGVSQQSINKYENHNVEPDIATLVCIADFFDVTIDYLVGRACDINDNHSEEALLIKNYRQLDNKEKFCLNTLAKSFIDAKKHR
ncbi:MAG: helix-turn-helix transcriptional regulator [Oscillospiraceae bacterium]|nr:helix-turn-helix transcriptional regulator [Oscillospiraceae bacterium]MBQ7119267.1 helix-turn-helix transcriptional regulator [Oscillospiraceae bacterium]